MYPTLQEVKKIAASGKFKRIPVCRDLYSDGYTPVQVMRILRGASRHCYLLESASQSENWGRFSFLGYDPAMEITCTDGLVKIRSVDENGTLGEVEKQVAHPKDAIREILAQYKSPVMEGFPPFTGGLVGYFSYDYIKYSEPKLKLEPHGQQDFRDMDLMLFDRVIAFDHYRQKILLIAGVMVGDLEESCGEANGKTEEFCGGAVGKAEESRGGAAGKAEEFCGGAVGKAEESRGGVAGKAAGFRGGAEEKLEEAYRRAEKKLEEIAQLLKNGKPMDFQRIKLHSEIAPQFPKEKYCSMVEKAKHYIREGDIFQVVLSNPMRAKAEGSLFDTYRVLRATNPSPYMFYFSSDDIEIAGASPETLVSLKAGKLNTFPLAGTRPRGKTKEEDILLEKELLADEKERAEHNMLVDLGRNDIGKISKIGTVEVEKYMGIERYSHVMHIGSTVVGDIREDKDAVDAVDAILPAGTLSGAPKFRACEIIEELEQSKRGIYGGAIGYLDFAGNLDVCIAIRLAYKKNGEICIRSGAGIVADSVPENEFVECCNKAMAVIRAIETAQEGLE